MSVGPDVSTMAIGDLVSRLLGRDAGDDAEFYRCSTCDATFEWAEESERASCPVCLSSGVSPVWDTTDFDV